MKCRSGFYYFLLISKQEPLKKAQQIQPNFTYIRRDGQISTNSSKTKARHVSSTSSSETLSSLVWTYCVLNVAIFTICYHDFIRKVNQIFPTYRRMMDHYMVRTIHFRYVRRSRTAFQLRRLSSFVTAEILCITKHSKRLVMTIYSWSLPKLCDLFRTTYRIYISKL